MRNSSTAILISFLILLLMPLFMLINCSAPSSTVLTPLQVAERQMKESSIPYWVKEHPVDPDYYIGIGAASITEGGTDPMRIAQDLALNDLASQIKISIQSDMVSTLLENSDLNEETFLATVRSQVIADLQGHELVDTYRDDDFHYAYYRLSKAHYADIQRRKREAAIALSSEYYIKAMDKTRTGDLSTGLQLLLQAFQPVLPYLSEALKTELSGKTIILENELYLSLHSILSSIRLQANKTSLNGKLGKGLEEPLYFSARTEDGRAIPQLPLSLIFLKGAADMVPRIETNSEGIAYVTLSSITSSEKLQVLQASVDLKPFYPENASPLLSGLVSGLDMPRTTVSLTISRPVVYMESIETSFGRPAKHLQAEPIIKNQLLEQGFYFVDDSTPADWHVKLKTSVSRGTEFNGMYSAFADLSLSILDTETGEEIYTNSLSRVKGIDLNYAAAARKATVNGAKQLQILMLKDIFHTFK